MAATKRAGSSSGAQTKMRIVDATLETLQEEGIVGTSARAIARRGNFNQALIFYHFGSVDEAIVAAIGELSARRIARYREPLMSVDSLTDLIEVARELYENDRASGEVTVLTQAFAGASRNPDMGPAMYDHIQTWNTLVAEVVERSIAASPMGGTPIAAMVPIQQVATAISALFLGIELFGQLDPERSDTDAMFTSIAAMAQLAESMLASAFPQDLGT